MIQQTDGRRRGAAMQQLNVEGPNIWKMIHGNSRREYSLEVTQNPLRARMCGFGDKDRRPLAPAAVAKMVVRNDDGSIVDVKDVDCSFFLVTVDLWSADAKQEMNLVLHPSSSDRYVPQNPPKPPSASSSTTGGRGRGGSTSGQRQLTPASRNTPTPSQSRTGEVNSETTSASSPDQSYPYAPPTPSEGVSLTPVSYAPSQASSADPPTWGYSAERNSAYPPTLPPIHQGFGRPSSEPWQPTEGPGADSETYRPWTAESGYQNASPGPADGSDMSWPPQGQQYSREASEESPNFAPAYLPANQQGGKAAPVPSTSVMPPLPRHHYTRTLVGPLCANAAVLQDEHRKPGIFFLFQDLSVRTEGTFRLRMRLMNVGAPPAPDWGSKKVNTETSPVLAQTFTEPFTVYSAKRFPGVPDTTALSIAFGNQGQKLPLRNRHGSGKRRRPDNDSDDDSDGE